MELADLFRCLQRHPDADRYYGRALGIYEKTLGPDHPEIAKMLLSMAVNYDYQHLHQDAVAAGRRSLASRETTLGPDHPRTADSLNILGSVYLKQSSPIAAQPLLRRALETAERLFGATAPKTLEYAQDYLRVLQALKHRHEITKLRKRFPTLPA